MTTTVEERMFKAIYADVEREYYKYNAAIKPEDDTTTQAFTMLAHLVRFDGDICTLDLLSKRCIQEEFIPHVDQFIEFNPNAPQSVKDLLQHIKKTHESEQKAFFDFYSNHPQDSRQFMSAQEKFRVSYDTLHACRKTLLDYALQGVSAESKYRDILRQKIADEESNRARFAQQVATCTANLAMFHSDLKKIADAANPAKKAKTSL
jgi:hypothetical protein